MTSLYSPCLHPVNSTGQVQPQTWEFYRGDAAYSTSGRLWTSTKKKTNDPFLHQPPTKTPQTHKNIGFHYRQTTSPGVWSAGDGALLKPEGGDSEWNVTAELSAASTFLNKDAANKTEKMDKRDKRVKFL